jgi:hypothetical protein
MLLDTYQEAYLVDTIKEIHGEMLEPPEKVKANEVWLRKWKPPVKRNIDWGDLKGSLGGVTAPQSGDKDLSEFCDSYPEYQEPKYLTIGLIGESLVTLAAMYPNNRIIFTRPTQCRQVFFIERTIWDTQGSSL